MNTPDGQGAITLEAALEVIAALAEAHLAVAANTLKDSDPERHMARLAAIKKRVGRPEAPS